VLLAEERPLALTLREMGADVLIQPAIHTLPRTLSPIRLMRHLLLTREVTRTATALVKLHQIGVVHAVQETMWPALVGLPTSAGRVVSVHGLRFASPPWAGKLNTRLLVATVDRIICVSQVVQTLFLAWRVPQRKLALVRSSVDLQRFNRKVSGSAFRHEIGVSAEAPLVGTVGSVDERKGHVYFLDACARIHIRYPAARFVIVGHSDDGPADQVDYVRELRTRAGALGLNRCLSFVPARPDVPEVMAALDILVQPSLTEAGPRAPLEAMAMARPVVGTRIEGTAEEVMDGETGLLVEPRDGLALAGAIATLLDDTALRARMGRAGRARIEETYSLAATAGLIEQLYEDVAMAGGN
jgi:glycosyltransferase involved in cell wall biosynthesis